MKLIKPIVSLALMSTAGALFFGGYAPDGSYKILPGYFPDEQQHWQAMPFPEANVTEQALAPDAVHDRQARQQRQLQGRNPILFGDTHVHTTDSIDAFMFSLPLMHGAEGAFPPGYACDYARFVSQLDFYFLTDHAESYEANRWNDAIESIRQCNRQANPSAPDLMAFMGWEWTQVGATAKTHYGHHNVLFKGYEPGDIPTRPIAAKTDKMSLANRSLDAKLPKALQFITPRHKDYLAAYNDQIENMAATPECEEGIPSPELPDNCYESTATPGELYKKLDEWGIDSLVIPHGTTWGWYTPPNASWEHQLNAENMDDEKSKLIEIFSGHGNSENYRDFSAREFNAQGAAVCPEPQADYVPVCWRAGEIIRERCMAEKLTSLTCDKRAQVARQRVVERDDNFGMMAVTQTTAEDWLDAGQARGMFLPALNYRAGKSVQTGLAQRKFTDDGEVLGFKWGILASSDTHSARAGHGFKQQGRLNLTEANGPRDEFWKSVFLKEGAPKSSSVLADKDIDPVSLGLGARDVERISSFLNVGGLAAVHAEERSRDALWSAMKRREVYGTSGHRMLLWFDLINADGSFLPMGSELNTKKTPSFKVRAVGSFKQRPGCPDYVVDALATRHLEKMSLGECYYPSDERYRIDRIEVVRIKPQAFEHEPLNELVEDQWKVFDCPENNSVCEVTFSDPDYAQAGRDALYYVRAIEEAIPTINGDNLRPQLGADGQVNAVTPCYGDYKSAKEDQCHAAEGQRAWSSPIFVNYPKQ